MHELEDEPLSDVEQAELDKLTNPDDNPDEKYKWDEEFQRTIIGLLLNDRWFATQCRDLVKPSYFVDERHQLVCRILFDHIDSYKAIPSKTLVMQEVKDKTANKDEQSRFHYTAEIELIYKKYVPGLDTREAFLAKIINFAADGSKGRL